MLDESNQNMPTSNGARVISIDLDLWYIFMLCAMLAAFASAYLWSKNVDLDHVITSVVPRDIRGDDLESIRAKLESNMKLFVPIGASFSILYTTVIQSVCMAVVVYVFDDKKIKLKTAIQVASVAKIVFIIKSMLVLIILFGASTQNTFGQILPISIGHALGLENIRSIAYDVEPFVFIDVAIVGWLAFGFGFMRKTTMLYYAIITTVVIFMHKLF